MILELLKSQVEAGICAVEGC